MNLLPIKNTVFTMSILFRMRKRVIYCRVTLNGERCNCDFTTGIKIDPASWDQHAQRMKGRSEEATAVNTFLSQIRANIYQAMAALDAQGEEVTADRVKALVIGTKKKRRLLDVYQEYIDQKKAAGMHPRTIQARTKSMDLLSEFLAGRKDLYISPSAVTVQMADDFHSWLLSRSLGADYVARQIETLKAVMRLAVQRGDVSRSALHGYVRSRNKPQPPVGLSSEQVQAIALHAFLSPALQRCADLFCWQCYTGMDYGDTMSFDPAQHTTVVDGKVWISRVRQKGGKEHRYELPLSAPAHRILAKYWGVLPHVPNATYNRYLKEIAALLGIQQRITTHTGRKTFAVWAINELGVSYEVLSRMLGHASTKLTESTYARVDRRRMHLELDGKLEGVQAEGAQ